MKRLIIDEKLCIGCYACSSACDDGLICVKNDGNTRKITVSGLCRKECSNCQLVCPTEAISFTDDISSVYQEISLAMVTCNICALPVMPEKMVDFLAKRTGQDVYDMQICLKCRQKVFSESLKSNS